VLVRGATPQDGVWSARDLRRLDGDQTNVIAEGDVVVLATESLWETLGDEVIQTVFTREAPRHWSLALLQKVRATKQAPSVSLVVALEGQRA
jgi:hypothetical protein